MYIRFAYGLGGDKNRDGKAIKRFVDQTLRAQFPEPQHFVGTNEYDDDIAADIVHQYQPEKGPIALLGFSNGVAGIVRATNNLPQVQFAHLILIDGIPPIHRPGMWFANPWHLHTNVLASTSFQRTPNIGLLVSHGIKNEGSQYVNALPIMSSHLGFPEKAELQSRIVQILKGISAT